MPFNSSVSCCGLVQLQKEAREKEETLQRMLAAEKRVRTLEEDNRHLRREVSEMKKELDKLRKEVRTEHCPGSPSSKRVSAVFCWA